MKRLNNYFRKKYAKFYGKKFVKEYEKKINTEYKKTIVINHNKINDEELVNRLRKKKFVLKKINNTYMILKQKFSPGSTTEYLLGYYHIMDSSSTYPVEALNPSKKNIVLDACSAPGGKTYYMSQLMNNKGIIVSVDVSKNRMKSQLFNLQRLGVKNSASIIIDLRNIKELGINFDKILLDAPCSGTGVWWRDKKSINRVREKDILEYAKVQKELLKSCKEVLKKDGILVYSTCSLEPEENEENVKFAENTGLITIEMQKYLPQKNDCLGFFYAKFKN